MYFSEFFYKEVAPVLTSNYSIVAICGNAPLYRGGLVGWVKVWTTNRQRGHDWCQIRGIRITYLFFYINVPSPQTLPMRVKKLIYRSHPIFHFSDISSKFLEIFGKKTQYTHWTCFAYTLLTLEL